MKPLFYRASIVILLFFITGSLSALSPASWQYLTSKHFTVSYTDSTAKYAEAAITCAENTLDVLGSSFGYIPGEKISIVLKDDLDYSNGGAAALIPHIEIYCRFVPFQYRLQREWIQNVISHELSHIYSLKKFAPVLLWDTGLEVRSSDWNSSLGVSLPVIGMPDLPRWFVEGIAQIGSWQYKADYRDPYREMVLRDSFINNKLLSLEEMSRFEGNSRDYELVYNQGFDFILFLTEKYPGISQGTLGRNIIKYGFTAAFEKTYGYSLAALHKQWLASLAVRYKDIPRTVQGNRLFNRTSLLNVETAAINNGEFVLANWNSESSACRIFKRSAIGTYRPISNDECYALKYDRKTGTGWFNKTVPNPDTFTETYDIFRIGYNYGVSRQTTNSRSLCFDVLDNHLYYARYKNGVTDIMHRIPDGWEISLYTFKENQSVMALAVLNPDNLLITIGEQTGAVLLTGNKATRLWEGYDIIDPVYAGDNRVLFVSTLDGTPQLYWTVLSGATDTWFKLTSVPGGVRFPYYETREGDDIIYFSVYENGDFNLYSRTNPFQQKNGIIYKDFPRSSIPRPVRREFTSAWQQTGSSLIFTPAVFTTGFLLSGMLFDNDAEKFLTTEIGFSAALLNAPGNFQLDYGVILDYPFVLNSQYDYSDQFAVTTHIVNSIQFPYVDIMLAHSLYVPVLLEPDGSPLFDVNNFTITQYVNTALASATFSLLPAILTNKLTYYLYSEEFPDHVDTNVFQQSFDIQNDFDFHEIRINLDYHQNQTMIKLGTSSYYYYPGNDYFTSSMLYVPSAELIYSPRSPYRVDPARLGQDQTYLLAGLQLPSLSLPENYNESDSPLVTFQFLNINTDLFWQKLLENRKMSFSFRFQGFSYVYAQTEQDIAYLILPTVDQYFPSYSSDSGTLKELMKASVGISINPFVKAEKPTHWYEQMCLAINAEGGLALYLENFSDYFNSGEKDLKLAYPLVLNISFSQQFYFNPTSPVNLDIAFLYPLMEFNGNSPHPAVRIEIKK